MDEDFLSKLKEKYANPKFKARPGEYDTACAILVEIEKELEGRYDILEPINLGGTGIVIKLRDHNLNAERALKVPRPIEGNEENIDKIMASEISHLCEVTHQNIIPIYYTDKIMYKDKEYHYYIMEYIDGAVDGLDYIFEKKPEYADLISFLSQWVRGLSVLHGRGILHGDTKLENVLVSPKNLITKISDFGSARLVSANNDMTSMTFTEPYAHPELVRFLTKKPTDPNRARVDINRSQLKISYDLYALGKNIFEILKLKEYADDIQITAYQRNYLTLLAARLLDGENNTKETFFTIPYRGMKQIKYNNTQEVLIDLKKANGEYSINELIPELNEYSKKTIQVNSSGLNTFTDRVSKLLNTRLVSRLASISQLGLMTFVYPTAVHSRYEHVLGTMLNVARYIDALWHDPVNPFFKQIITEKDINALLVAALFHDIGQYALAHDFEEAEKDLFSHTNNNKRLLKDSGIQAEVGPLLQDDWNLRIEDIYPILGITDGDSRDTADYKIRLLKSILDGPIDADKLDYLRRDSSNLNIPYGKAIDYSKIIRSLTVVFEHDNTNLSVSLGIHEKGKIAAEGMAFARYALFGSVYWHHTVRSIKAMLHRAVWEALLQFSDGKTKIPKDIQRDIYKEINNQLLREEQPWLLEKDTGKLKFRGNMNPYDFKILSYFYEITTLTGQTLLDMICERNFYKRLFIISASKSKTLWESIAKVRANPDWKVWLNFQKYFEDSLVETIKNIPESERTITPLVQENTDTIEKLVGSQIPVFLIDIPTARPGTKGSLQYLHEERFANSVQYNPDDMIQPENSVLWDSLATNLAQSIGKARIFCHPNIINTAAAFYKKNMIEKAIESSYRKVTDR
jgi:HD superfamily phosphohydrolase